MSQSNFDNEIKKQLGGLKVEPAAGMWEKIEPRLPKPERDKTWFLILLLIPVLLFGIYLLNNFFNSKPIAEHTASQPATQTMETQKNPTKSQQDVVGTNVAEERLPPGNDLGIRPTRPNEEKPKNSSSIPGYRQSTSKIINERNKPDLQRDSKVTYAEKARQQFSNKDDQQINNITNADPLQPSEKLQATNKSEGIKKTKIAETMKSSPDSTGQEAADNFTDREKNNTTKVAKKSGWHYGLHFGIGRSRVVKGFFTNSNSNNDLLYSSPSTGSTGSTGISTGVKSTVDDGLFLQGGLSINKDLGKRLKLESGLVYNVYRNKILVGKPVDSVGLLTPSRAYGNDGSNNYTSVYHYVQIPLLVKFTVDEKYLFRVSAGGSFNILAASNALVYNPAANNYFTRKDLFTKSTITFITGLEKDFGNGSSFPFTVGIRAGYNINSSLKTNYDRQHLRSLGLFVYLPIK